MPSKFSHYLFDKLVTSTTVVYFFLFTNMSRNYEILLFCMMLQVHGIVNDTIEFVRGILTTEMNSATDNPVSLFPVMQ